MQQQTQQQIMPYLFFEGRTEEALEFYKKTLGATVEMMMRFRDNPETPKAGEPGCGAGSADKVMHSCFRIGQASVMASDGMCSGKPAFSGFSLSVEATDEKDAKRKFDALAEGGQVQMPLGKTFFSPAFGMVADRFGVSWMVIVQPNK